MPKFFIEQLALCPADPEAAKELLTALGAVHWHNDHVTAHGEVYGEPATNTANLSFNYELSKQDALELEVLHYAKWHERNWMQHGQRHNSVSHLGMHCSAEELELWRQFFAERNIPVAQEVRTSHHTNPAIAGKRTYNYVIFDTKRILGVDLKFIVRINA